MVLRRESWHRDRGRKEWACTDSNEKRHDCWNADVAAAGSMVAAAAAAVTATTQHPAAAAAFHFAAVAVAVAGESAVAAE